MPRPERCQLAFDFLSDLEPGKLPRPDFYAMHPGRLAGLSSRETGVSRFVRTVQERIKVRSPADAARHLMEHIYTPFASFDQEEMWVLHFNTKGYLTHEAMVYRGTLYAVLVRTPELFRDAVRLNSYGLLLSHCHPSGDPTPSPEDVLTTEKVYQAAKLLDITLLDHIIVGAGVWVSLKERGLGFDEKEG